MRISTAISNIAVMHEYCVALKISGELLDVSATTEALGVEPTHVERFGETQVRGPVKKSVWSFEVFPSSGGEWKSLEEGLAALLQVFASRTSVIRQLQR